MIRSGYSFRSAFGQLDEVHSRVIECGLVAAPLADRCSTFGFVRWTKMCKKAGIKPVYGVELAVVPQLGEKRPTIDYWTFLALDSLRSIHELVAIATRNPGKEPSLTYEQAMAATGVVRIAGERARLDRFAVDDAMTFVALSPSISRGQFRACVRAGAKMVARPDNVFPRPADKELYRVALGRRAFTQTYPQWIVDDAEWTKAMTFVATAEEQSRAIGNRDFILTRCKAELTRAEVLRPEKPYTLEAMCRQGAEKLNIDLTDDVYAKRLARELELIEEKKFEDYFYIIADLVSWAKERMIVGPARGSSCGSLVCYLLGITTVDPIPFGLIFERFIDVNRMDLPDIDIDFSDVRRDLVFGYAEEKYGIERVARLGTVGMFKPKSALKQAGASLRIPAWLVERTLEGVTDRSGGDSRALQALEDALNDTEMGRKLMTEYPEAILVTRMEGHPNNAGQHAAGIVITQDPVMQYVAVDSRTKATMCDKKDAEELNLLKIDALGLTQLSIFERTLQLIGKPDVSGFLETLPLDDPMAFEVLNRGAFAGIFQFMGGALQSLTKQVEMTNIEDIISITALARPGPLATGGANTWVKRRMGLEKVTTQHPMLTELTKDTYGVVIYQETVMNIVRTMGQMSWEDTSAIRKAMSGRLGNEFFEKYWQKFRVGAIANGVEERIAKEIWDQVNTFGSWAFNRSHAVAYGIVSYWCCWLKAHHPAEFAAATLDAEKDPFKQIKLLRELNDEGTGYVAVDPEHSTDRWSFKDEGNRRTLVGPLTAIKGIGPSAVKEIMRCREKGIPLRPAMQKRLTNSVTSLDSIYPVADCVKKMDLASLKITSTPKKVSEVQCGIRGEVMILAVARRIAPVDENEDVKIMRRGGRRLDGPTKALNLFFQDDTDEIFCKVNREDFEKLGKPIIERGKPGKAIYAVKGTVPKGFRMISINNIRYLGDLT